jgi:hypothetical protein
VEAWQRAALLARRCADGAEAWRLEIDSHEGQRGHTRQYLGKDGRGGACDTARPRRVRDRQQEKSYAGQQRAERQRVAHDGISAGRAQAATELVCRRVAHGGH